MGLTQLLCRSEPDLKPQTTPKTRHGSACLLPKTRHGSESPQYSYREIGDRDERISLQASLAYAVMNKETLSRTR